MSNIPPQGNNQANVTQQITLPPTNPPQQSKAKTAKQAKTPATPADGLAVAALFIIVGVFAGYFPIYSHTPSINGICLAIAYICYSIGFLGGFFELGKLSKNQFWDTFGLGIVGVFMCFGVNWLADLANSIYALSLTIRVLMVLPLALAAYGVARGILYLVIKDNNSSSASQPAQNSAPQSGSTATKERMKPEQIAGIAIAILSVITALIQALPSLIPLVKQILHIP